MKIISRKKGFTLIELLVVVAIIGILAAVVMSSLNSAREKARDARRMSDIKEIGKAIELYIADNGYAPYIQAGGAIYDFNTAEWNELEDELKPYISKLPKDPCGQACFKKPSFMNAGFYSYQYFNPQDGSTLYGIMATNLEKKPSTFKINNTLGSFN